MEDFERRRLVEAHHEASARGDMDAVHAIYHENAEWRSDWVEVASRQEVAPRGAVADEGGPGIEIPSLRERLTPDRTRRCDPQLLRLWVDPVGERSSLVYGLVPRHDGGRTCGALLFLSASVGGERVREVSTESSSGHAGGYDSPSLLKRRVQRLFTPTTCSRVAARGMGSRGASRGVGRPRPPSLSRS